MVIDKFVLFYYQYRSRKEKALKNQSLIVLSNKLIRVFYTILKSDADYDTEKLISNIRRPDIAAEAA